MKIAETIVRTIAAPVGDAWDRVLLASIWFFLLAGIWFSVRVNLVDLVADELQRQGWGTRIFGPALIWLYMAAAMLALRTSLWIRYRPFTAARWSEAPLLTVIIPAFNEGAMVSRSIESCANADYPKDRLEIIVIDDGSTDDTWSHVLAAASRYPDLVRTLQFPVNQGKREALAAGFERARGDVLVTVDSDSAIERGALLAIAGPLRDPRVGAVAGKVSVINRNDGILPRMLHVRFVLSFDFLRSAQSVYRTVYCCPGALSAFRAAIIQRILPNWRGQTFLGEPCTIGEDRALTNEVLGAGYDVVYQRSAVVHTIVPKTYRQLCRMYLRWDRSYIREEFRLAKIVWRRPPISRVLTVVDSLLTNLRIPVAYAALVMAVAFSYRDPWTMLRILESIGVAGLFYSLYFLRSERSWEFVYGLAYAYFSSVALLWIFPYALLTVRNRSWLTR